MKHFIFKFFGYIASFAFLVILAMAFYFSQQNMWPVIIALVSATFSFIYFVHKQKLEELILFKELFSEFNKRYNEKNEKLNVILNGDSNIPLSDEEVEFLYDYFNLCGEEYLYYQKGYIYPEVWQAWMNGMKIFYGNPRIKKLWDEELATSSYYGLQL